MTNFNERIERLAELEAKATPGEWEGYDLSFCDHFLEQIISCCNGEKQILSLKHENSENNQQLICALRNEALPLLREMQAEIERLREGLKTMAQNFAEMEKLRSQFYTEKEQAETALLFANRERDTLQKRVDRAVDLLKKGYGIDITEAIKILTREGES